MLVGATVSVAAVQVGAGDDRGRDPDVDATTAECFWPHGVS